MNNNQTQYGIIITSIVVIVFGIILLVHHNAISDYNCMLGLGVCDRLVLIQADKDHIIKLMSSIVDDTNDNTRQIQQLQKQIQQNCEFKDLNQTFIQATYYNENHGYHVKLIQTNTTNYRSQVPSIINEDYIEYNLEKIERMKLQERTCTNFDMKKIELIYE